MRNPNQLNVALPQARISPVGDPSQGGARRYVQTENLFRNLAAAGTYATHTAGADIWIPSTRLVTIVTLGFIPDAAEDAVIPAGWVATIDAWGKTDTKGAYGGRKVRGNSIVPGPVGALPTQLPYSYEAVTGVDLWRIKVTVPAGGTGLAADGYLVASVSWEPAPGESSMSDGELAHIFQSCKVFPNQGAGGNVFNTVIP